MTETTSYLAFHAADVGDDEIEAVAAVLRSGWLTSGPRVSEFEAAFAETIGVRHAVAVNSATAALHLGLEAAGVCAGDEVIIPTMTFAASAEVVIYLNATPVLADCDPEILTLRAEDIEAVLTSRTKAIMPVHYGGHPCDMGPIMDLARRRGIVVVEDAAHSLPAADRGRQIGTIGDLTAFSFYATKTLTTGEGGMLTTDNAEYADRARLMSLHGISRNAWNRYKKEGSWRYDIQAPGFKYNLTDIAAAIGLVQLRKLRAMWQRRCEIARLYDEAFFSLPAVQPVGRRADIEHAWHLYAVRLVPSRLRIGRDAIIEELKARGIGTSVHFIPLHMHSLYGSADAGNLPNATAAFGELVSLPIYSKMTNEDAIRVVETLSDIVKTHSR